MKPQHAFWSKLRITRKKSSWFLSGFLEESWLYLACLLISFIYEDTFSCSFFFQECLRNSDRNSYETCINSTCFPNREQLGNSWLDRKSFKVNYWLSKEKKGDLMRLSCGYRFQEIREHQFDKICHPAVTQSSQKLLWNDVKLHLNSCYLQSYTSQLL